MTSHSYQLAVDNRDQLTVSQGACNHQPMVDPDELRRGFSKRLHQACDMARVRERGRAIDVQQALKRAHLSATTTAIGKWLNADSMPNRQNMLAIAEWLGVRVEWLAYGDGPIAAPQDQARAEQESAEYAAPARGTGMNMAALMRLKGKATPRSLAALDRIEKAAQMGRLKEADLVLLEGIAARFEELNSDKT